MPVSGGEEGVFAIVHSVEEKRIGSDLASSVSIGATSLPLDDADWANEDGGKLFVGGIHPDDSDVAARYTGVNYATNTLTGVSGIGHAWGDDTFVEPRPRQWEKYAEVWPEGAEYEDSPEPLVVRVHNALIDRLKRGTREPDTGERVFVERRGSEYVLYEIIGESGDFVVWQYTSKEDISASAAVGFDAPYAAILKECRATIQFEGTGSSEVNLYYWNNNDVMNVDPMTIPASKYRSQWVKIKDDDGWEVDEDDRLWAYMDTIGAGITGPFKLQIRVVPRGAA